MIRHPRTKDPHNNRRQNRAALDHDDDGVARFQYGDVVGEGADADHRGGVHEVFAGELDDLAGAAGGEAAEKGAGEVGE